MPECSRSHDLRLSIYPKQLLDTAAGVLNLGLLISRRWYACGTKGKGWMVRRQLISCQGGEKAGGYKKLAARTKSRGRKLKLLA